MPLTVAVFPRNLGPFTFLYLLKFGHYSLVDLFKVLSLNFSQVMALYEGARQVHQPKHGFFSLNATWTELGARARQSIVLESASTNLP